MDDAANTADTAMLGDGHKLRQLFARGGGGVAMQIQRCLYRPLAAFEFCESLFTWNTIA
jgi:hypothetical protein